LKNGAKQKRPPAHGHIGLARQRSDPFGGRIRVRRGVFEPKIEGFHGARWYRAGSHLAEAMIDRILERGRHLTS